MCGPYVSSVSFVLFITEEELEDIAGEVEKSEDEKVCEEKLKNVSVCNDDKKMRKGGEERQP